MAEKVLHNLNRQYLNRHMHNIEVLIKEIEAWQHHQNNQDSKTNWQFTNAYASVKLKKLYPSIYN